MAFTDGTPPGGDPVAVRDRDVLESVLDSMDSYIYVTDLDTDEILFANKKMASDWGLDRSLTGEPCWKYLQRGQEKRCDFCPKRKLVANPDEPVRFKTHNAIVGKTLNVIARVIDWPGGKRVHMEQAVDVTEAEYARNTLVQREKILDILNRAATIFLKRGQEALDDTMAKGIGLVAGIANVDRLSVFRNMERPDGLHLSQLYRWRKEVGGTLPVRENLVDSSYAALFPRWEGILAGGDSVGGIARLMPEADTLKLFDSVTLLAVPVFTDGVFWGMVLFEKLVEENFTAYETEVLRSASFMLASAVMRNEEAAVIRQGNEYAKLMLDATPLGCVLWSPDHTVIDCNSAILNILHVSDKEAFLARRFDYSPELQPDGRRSREKMLSMLDRALDEGHCVFDWMHQTQDGAPFPAEITLVRVPYGDSYVIPGYTRDLSAVRQFEKNILQLESEVKKIYHDPLTGIYNRRFFDENMERLIATLSRSGSELSLLMIDVDHFKQYNDLYGHQKGDECLRNIADALRGAITRNDDFVARYGGEEFVIVLPNTDESGARKIARKLLADMRRRNMPHERNRDVKRVTISIGVTSGRVKHTFSASDFIQRADAMLYESKRSGRNRYAFSSFTR